MSEQAAWDALSAALGGVQGLRVAKGPGDPVDPPAALVGPPRLVWESPCPEPTTAVFVVHLFVPMNERALSQLFKFRPLVTDALESLSDAVVRRADPGLFRWSNHDLPAFNIVTEYAL